MRVETNLKYLLGNYLAICEGPVPEEVSLLLSMPVWKANSYFMLLIAVTLLQKIIHIVCR